MSKLSKKIYNNLINLEDTFNSKFEFVETVCNLPNIKNWNIPISHPSEWIDIMFKKNTWQLTDWGAKFLSSTYTYYDLQNKNNENIACLTGKILVGMDRIMNGPWYIHTYNIVRIWDQNKHFELQLLHCDFARYVDFNATS